MTDTKRKRGRPLKGDRPAKRIGFYVSADDHEWLTALPNRSEWIAKKVAGDRDTDKATNGGADETTAATEGSKTR
jgi:hypothetical protein